MNRKTLWFVSVVASAAMLVLNVGHVHAQTPGQIPVFDQPGTGFCNSTGGNDCLDSVMTQDPNGNIGIGTTAPSNRLQIVSGNDTYPGLTLEGNATTFNGIAVTLLNRAGGNTNPWVVGTGGALGPHFFSIGDSFAYRLVISDSGNVGIGVLNPGGKLHVQSASNTAVRASSSFDVAVQGNTDNPSLPAILAVSAGSEPFNLGLDVVGRFIATGTKNAVVPLQDGQHVLLTAEESTEVWFSDYGTVQLVYGRAVVQIDAQYLQTVNTEKDYHVFLTARGNPKGSLYIDHETPSSFEIRESTGTASIKVSYRIVAKRKDFADERLKKVDAPLAYHEPTSQSATLDRDAEGNVLTAGLP